MVKTIYRDKKFVLHLFSIANKKFELSFKHNVHFNIFNFLSNKNYSKFGLSNMINIKDPNVD